MGLFRVRRFKMGPQIGRSNWLQIWRTVVSRWATNEILGKRSLEEVSAFSHSKSNMHICLL